MRQRRLKKLSGDTHGFDGLLRTRLRFLLAALEGQVSPADGDAVPGEANAVPQDGQWFVAQPPSGMATGAPVPRAPTFIHVMTHPSLLGAMSWAAVVEGKSPHARVLMTDENDMLSADRAAQVLSFLGQGGRIDDLAALERFGSLRRCCAHDDEAKVGQWLRQWCQELRVTPSVTDSLVRGAAFTGSLFAGRDKWEVSSDGLMVSLIVTGRLHPPVAVGPSAVAPLATACDAHAVTVCHGDNGCDQVALTFPIATPAPAEGVPALKCLIVVRQDARGAKSWDKAS